MDLIPTNCPNCNSPQKFPLKFRKENEYKVAFIYCSMCKEEWILERATNRQYLDRRKSMRQRIRKMR